MIRFAAFLVFCWITRDAFSQEPATILSPGEQADSIRESHIQRFPDHFFIYPVLKQRSLSFELARADRTKRLTFKPNNTFSVGLGVYLFEVGAELAFAVPLDQLSKNIYGDSDARDLNLSVMGKRFGLDAFYQRYTGFYITEKDRLPAPGSPFPHRADLVSRNFGITGNYVFNYSKFSFSAFYNYAERQLQSKGSFLLSANISTFRVAGDSSIITTAQESDFGPEVSFTRLRYTTFSIAPGYTYSLVFRNFFLNGALSAGPAHHWISYQLKSGDTKDDIALNSFVTARIGIGYNGNRIFGGIGFFTRGSVVKIQDAEFSNSNGSFKILMGYRFLEKGFLTRRAWDLLPFNL